MKPVIVAIDFETANYAASSACQLGLVRLEGFKVTHREAWLIRPPSDEFVFTHIHGLTWDDVKDSPDFAKLWNKVYPLCHDADHFAAHNAPFDKGVLSASLAHYGLKAPKTPFIDTVQVARATFNIFPTKLNNVCEKLNIELNHHEALSDASAAAEILIQAAAKGWRP